MPAEIRIHEVAQPDNFIPYRSIKAGLFQVKGNPIVHLIRGRNAGGRNRDDAGYIRLARCGDWSDPRTLARAMQADSVWMDIGSRLQIFHAGNHTTCQVLEICGCKITLGSTGASAVKNKDGDTVRRQR